MTKIAYRSGSRDNLRRWVEAGPEAHMTTRYLPKRHEEMIGGSLYWIIEHAIVAFGHDMGRGAHAITVEKTRHFWCEQHRCTAHARSVHSRGNGARVCVGVYPRSHLQDGETLHSPNTGSSLPWRSSAEISSKPP